MEDPAKMELRHWANFEQIYLKDFLKDQPAIKLTDVLAERDVAIAERNAAIAEKKTAYVEKDTALMQRDMAHAERNAACMERNSALFAISSSINADDSNGNANAKLMQIVNFAMNQPSMGSNLLSLPNSDSQIDNNININNYMEAMPQPKKMGKNCNTTKKQKGSGVRNLPNGGSKSPTKHRKLLHAEQECTHAKSAKVDVLKNFATHVAPYDLSSTSIPFCSCTGINRQCYRWGSGGWQSACCTNFLSVYPLPMNKTKRLAGRKMSGGAFKKLLERLEIIGVDTSKPIDLKDHWAKHGTNRYVTIK